ncbi:uncharacterized protein LOC123547097 [Mercenaria mercenaria]|uniref:uncharacterized protein LOC123547097 n=1 Tax=Mercenaria mercenaria TaxID=6596 RepID=UPI001E1E01FC|nr:uncharacterized protein LOC123547097 [Mercenaria mercenaria]
MFRNFYEEQNMADPRDSWYKPNLLYNIHYRPPKPPTPPKMMVVTREFNPSVCTCGEHDCAPHYRMEREVLWSNKKFRNEADRELKKMIQAKTDAKPQRESFVDVDDDKSETEEEEDGANGEDGEEWKGDEYAEVSFGDIKEANILVNVAKSDADNLPINDDLTKQDKTEAGVLHVISDTSIRKEEDYEDFGSSFGIMSVYCGSDLHTWSWKSDSIVT